MSGRRALTLAELNTVAGGLIYHGQNGPVNHNGTDAAEIISGSTGQDSIAGGGGNDTIQAFGGADVIDGGAGSDWIVWRPGDGNDTIYGGCGTGESDVLQLATYGFAPTPEQLARCITGGPVEIRGDGLHLDGNATYTLSWGTEKITLTGIERITAQKIG